MGSCLSKCWKKSKTFQCENLLEYSLIQEKSGRRKKVKALKICWEIEDELTLLGLDRWDSSTGFFYNAKHRYDTKLLCSGCAQDLPSVMSGDQNYSLWDLRNDSVETPKAKIHSISHGNHHLTIMSKSKIDALEFPTAIKVAK